MPESITLSKESTSITLDQDTSGVIEIRFKKHVFRVVARAGNQRWTLSDLFFSWIQTSSIHGIPKKIGVYKGFFWSKNCLYINIGESCLLIACLDGVEFHLGEIDAGSKE